MAETSKPKLEVVQIVRMIPRTIWIESDFFGSRHIVCQDEGYPPFTFASFFYDYAFTSNAQIATDALDLARKIGATDPVELRFRDIGDLFKKHADGEAEYKSWFDALRPPEHQGT